MVQRKITYKQAIHRLEEIMSGIEKNQYDIDELVPILKESRDLMNYCKEKLFNVEMEVNKILDDKSDNNVK